MSASPDARFSAEHQDSAYRQWMALVDALETQLGAALVAELTTA